MFLFFSVANQTQPDIMFSIYFLNKENLGVSKDNFDVMRNMLEYVVTQIISF